MQTTPAHITATPRLGRYEIDTSRSTVRFRTRHMFGLAPVRGTFAIRGGTIDVAEPLTESAVHAEIDVASFRTGNPVRDKNVRSAGLLGASEHPVMTFISERMNPPTLSGMLTVRGVARPVVLSIEQLTVLPDSFTARAGVRIDRTDFGVTASRGLASARLDLTVEVTCVRS
jgi:polyisoprenoid-binding protein YceI